MAGTIEFLQGAIKHGKADWEKKFPAIEDVMVVHNTALAQICPMYMKQYLDSDKTAFYLLARCNPLKGDCSRQMACAWLEDLFYDKCGCPSSYDVEAGGTMSRKVAISKELLPADNDAEYMDFYQEQMAKMKEMFAAEQKAAKKEEFIAKNGFDPDDPDIIDVDVDEPTKALPGDGTTSVEQSAGTAVGMPKPIWYGAVFHANGFGMKLGWDKKVWTLSQGNTTIDKLGFNPAGPQLTEKEEDEMVGEALGERMRSNQRIREGMWDDDIVAMDKKTGKIFTIQHSDGGYPRDREDSAVLTDDVSTSFQSEAAAVAALRRWGYSPADFDFVPLSDVEVMTEEIGSTANKVKSMKKIDERSHKHTA